MKLQETAAAVTLEPERPADATVIWLHGLGADGHDFVPIVPELGLPPGHGLRFIFPHAPVRPVSLNGGLPMRAWYDILGLDRHARQDAQGIRAAEGLVQGVIAAEQARGIAPGRVVLAGFSQGGAIALHAGLRLPQRLAGVLALSTYLPLPDSLAAEASAANRDVPILMCHGEFDPVLDPALGEQSCALLRQAGYSVDWRSYPMQHQVCAEEIAVIGQWLRQRLPPLD
jgi:phospholipase/carboxylesterase